jgi:hypothetical protein
MLGSWAHRARLKLRRVKEKTKMTLPEMPELNYLPSTTRDMVFCLLENYGKACWAAAQAESREMLRTEPISIQVEHEASALPQSVAPFPPLESVTRATADTAAAAYYLNRRPQTLRSWASKEDGPLRPMRINGRLAWPVTELRRVLDGRTDPSR